MKIALSLPVRGAWIEIRLFVPNGHAEESLPVRGAWIEIIRPRRYTAGTFRRSPCGERGLKYKPRFRLRFATGRSPCGERGLKWYSRVRNSDKVAVAPRAGSVD